MCKNPGYIWLQRGPKAVKQRVNCKKCTTCIVNHKNDYAGRCLAEASTSDWVFFCTLTYANDEGCEYGRYDGADLHVQPKHFQDWIRAVRDKYKSKEPL